MLKKSDEGGAPSNTAQILDQKKTYVSPSLVEYGSVAKLTQNGQGSGADGGAQAGMMMVCL